MRATETELLNSTRPGCAAVPIQAVRRTGNREQRALALGLLTLTSGLVPIRAQGGAAATPPTAAPVLVTIPGVGSIDEAEYGRYLVDVMGPLRLRELAYDRILAHEIAQTVAADPALGARWRGSIEQIPQQVEAAHARRVQQDFQGSESAYRAYLRRIGSSDEAARRTLRIEIIREQSVQQLIQVDRNRQLAAGTANKALQRVFEDAYGVGGLAVELQHVFVSFGAIRNRIQERRRGFPATEQEVQRMATQRAEAIGKARANGARFHDLVARFSDDPLARQLAEDPQTAPTAGRIVNYSFQRFGAEFASAVRAMAPGEIRGPVRTSHGMHWIWLESRTQTDFAKVRDAVVTRWLAAEPSRAERRTLRERLLARYPIENAAERPTRRKASK